MLKKLWPWFAWVALTASMSAYLAYRIKGPDQTVFLPGPTTHGHYQIEINCNVCHDPMMGIKEQACYDCHGADLKAANDAHPKSKFTDPRNADRVAALDARKCITCHKEHMPDRTHEMGLTLPPDFCAKCHQETIENRPSHKDLGFTSCATAGCHNYHDNTALYENFLARHALESDFKEDSKVLPRNLLAFLTQTGDFKSEAEKQPKNDAPASLKYDAEIDREWLATAHAQANVNCTVCHNVKDEESATLVWTNTPNHTTCEKCHEPETQTFLKGKHGLRLAAGLRPMKPAMARLPMKKTAADRELNCVSCHGSHAFDTQNAAVESCLECHNDQHSLAYKDSPHYSTWRDEITGKAPAGTGVSCATCHLPRVTHKEKTRDRTLVMHNQNHHLQPNESMIRSSCINCHGVEFAIDALADPTLIKNNFSGKPSHHIESMDWVKDRLREKQNN